MTGFAITLLMLLGQFVMTGHHRGKTGPIAPCGSPVTAWPMNEGSGTTLNDTSGNSNTATIVGGSVTWTANVIKSGVSSPVFSGTQRGSATTASFTSFTNVQPFSVIVWMTQSGTQNAAWVNNLNTPTLFNGWEIGTDGVHTKVNFYVVNNTASNIIQVQGSTTINTGALFMVVGTYDGSGSASGVKLYVNGAAETNNVIQNTLSSSSASTVTAQIAQRNNGTNAFSGAIGYVSIHNCVLTSAQVASAYSAGPGIY